MSSALPTPPAGFDRRGLAAFAVAALLLQLVLFNRDFSVDGLNYAQAVERGTPLLHSNHLLFNVVQAGLWRLLNLVGEAPLRAVWSMQALNVCAAVAAAVALATLAARRAGVLIGCGIGALLLGGFGFWHLTQEPEVYVLPLALVCGSLWLLDVKILDRSRVWALALLCTAAVLLLQQSVFWYPALLLLAWPRIPSGQRRWLLVLLPPLLAFGVYFALGWSQDLLQNPQGWLSWFLGYGYNGVELAPYRVPPPFPQRLAGLLLGLGNLLFAWELVLRPLLWPLAGLAALLLLDLARRVLLRPNRDCIALLLYAGLNLGFAFWWESRNIEFLLPLWVAAVALCALRADRLSGKGLLAAVAILVGINAGTSVVEQRNTPARYQVALALANEERLRPDDALMTEELNTVLWLRYFHGIDIRFVPGAINGSMHANEGVETIHTRINEVLGAGHRVYTTELDEHGRLRAIAGRLGILGLGGPEGIETTLHLVYAPYALMPLERVPGVRRVALRETAP